MLKLKSVCKDYIWGGDKLKSLYGRQNGEHLAESWEVSVHPDGTSMYLASFADYIKNNPQAVDKQGSAFPVLIKYIDAKQNLSVQVHPDDEYARRVEGDNAKRRCGISFRRTAARAFIADLRGYLESRIFAKVAGGFGRGASELYSRKGRGLLSDPCRHRTRDLLGVCDLRGTAEQ